jgi:hypothetical protein
MNRVKSIEMVGRGRFSALVAFLVLGLLLSATGAKAGCGDPFKAGANPLMPFLGHQDDGGWSERSIVGLWHVVYTANDGSKFLESFKTWHGDGTEFENAFLPPSGGNICFGVWKEIERATVKLHHIGLMFAADGSISNTFTVDEVDNVAHHGKTYAGNFDFKLYDPAGNMVAEVKGTTAGTRITVR